MTAKHKFNFHVAAFAAMLLSPAAFAEPVSLTSADLDRVTAGTIVAADAVGSALGPVTITLAQTQTFASPHRGKGKANASAAGQYQVVAGSLVGLTGDEISAIIAALAAAPNGGAAATRVSGTLNSNRKFEVVVLRASAVAIGPDAEAITLFSGSVPDGAIVRIRQKERDTKWGERSTLVVRIRVPTGG